MALFIEVEVSPALTSDPAAVKQLAEVCPVDIFAPANGGGLHIVDANVDECTLCELCLAGAPPGAVKVVKLYDEGRALRRGA